MTAVGVPLALIVSKSSVTVSSKTGSEAISSEPRTRRMNSAGNESGMNLSLTGNVGNDHSLKKST